VISSPNCINRPVFLKGTRYVFCEVWTNISFFFRLQRVKFRWRNLLGTIRDEKPTRLLLYGMNQYTLHRNEVRISLATVQGSDVRCKGDLTGLKEQANTIYPWPESARELYRPSDSCLSAKLVSTFAARGWHVVRMTDPTAVFSAL
jgi:hypothetical protein